MTESRSLRPAEQLITTTVDGRRVSALAAGDGPLVVLLPPGASPASAWRRIMAGLVEAGFACVAINPSGYGETESFAGDRPMRLADEAAAALALLGAPAGDVHLVGHSYGGAVALHMALADPDRFASLTLLEPAAYPMLRQAGEHGLHDEVEAVNQTFIARVGEGERARALRDYIDYYNLGDGAWDALAEEAKTALLGRAETIAAALTAVHASDDRLADIAHIAAPILVAAGAETDPVHAGLAAVIAKQANGAPPALIAEAGHMAAQTHPAAFAELLLAHISAD